MRVFRLLLAVIPLLLTGALSNGALHGQSLNRLLRQAVNTSRLTLSHRDSVEVFTVVAMPTHPVPHSDRFYTWYAANSLKHTQGGYNGKLVHGTYVLSNHQKDLLARGRYHQGLKVGQWRLWYPGGAIYATQQWHRGQQHGPYVVYDPAGNPQEKGTYRRGLRQGKRMLFAAGTLVQTEKYRRGTLRTPPRPAKVPPALDKTAPVPSTEATPVKRKTFWQRLAFWKKKPTVGQPPTARPAAPSAKEKRRASKVATPPLPATP